MRKFRRPIGLAWHVLCPALVLGLSISAAAQTPALPPVDLVKQTIYNETQALNKTKFMFRSRKENPRGSQTKLVVETMDAIAAIIIANDDKPLTAEQRVAENARVDRFVNDPEELKKKQRQEKDDADRIGRIMRALPEAFIYEYDGTEPGHQGMGKPGHVLQRLKFRPNPNYDPPSRVEQILPGMQGYVLIDANEKRMAKIDGTLQEDVSFGWGILGHLDKGGHFAIEQADVGDDRWETSRMDLAFTGKILLFKSLSIKQTEVESDFHPVPANLTFAQGLELLRKQAAELEAKK